MLDGLDEVVGDAVLGRVAQSIAEVARTYPMSPILITCRVLDYQAERLRQISGFPTQILADLTDEQIKQFVADWYAELAASGRRSAGQSGADTQALQQAIATRSELSNLARLPLLLTVMALVHTNKGTLPDARALLYQECIELLLLRWRQPRGTSDLLARFGLSQFRSSDLLALIARLGFYAHELAERSAADPTRPADLREAEVMEVLAAELALYDASRKYDLAETLLGAVASGNGLLLKRGPGVYAFPHRTFQEFLSGYHLKGQREFLTMCLERAGQAHWHEALALMTGYQVLADREREKPLLLAEKLLERGPVEQALAGELLNLIGRERTASYNPALIRPGGLWHRAYMTLLGLATSGQAPGAPAPLRVRAGLALGTLCYGALDTLCQPDALPPLPDPRLPLAVVSPTAARSEKWNTALHAYWCAIPAGLFWYGDDLRGELEQVELPYPYKIARYPTTNAEFARFVAAGGYAERRWWTDNGWKAREQYGLIKPPLFDDPHFNSPLQPVTGVLWYEATAYCAWLTAQGHAQGWLPREESHSPADLAGMGARRAPHRPAALSLG